MEPSERFCLPAVSSRSGSYLDDRASLAALLGANMKAKAKAMKWFWKMTDPSVGVAVLTWLHLVHSRLHRRAPGTDAHTWDVPTSSPSSISVAGECAKATKSQQQESNPAEAFKLAKRCRAHVTSIFFAVRKRTAKARFRATRPGRSSRSRCKNYQAEFLRGPRETQIRGLEERMKGESASSECP